MRGRGIFLKTRQIIKYWVILVAFVVMICSESKSFAASGKANYDYAFKVLKIVNKERKAEGLSALKMDEELLKTANVRVKEITQLFSHERPDGTDCFSAFTRGGTRGENIAYGYTSAKAVMKGWMNSSGHKANILSDSYRSIGIGCYCYNGEYYWVQCFSSEKATEVKDAKAAKKLISRQSDNAGISKVGKVKITAAKKKLTVTWKKQSDVDGYQLQISTDSKFKISKRTTYTVKQSAGAKKGITKLQGKKLKSKKKYYVRIRAYADNDSNGETTKVYGKWTTVSKKTK
jgi:hypothetical protein